MHKEQQRENHTLLSETRGQEVTILFACSILTCPDGSAKGDPRPTKRVKVEKSGDGTTVEPINSKARKAEDDALVHDAHAVLDSAFKAGNKVKIPEAIATVVEMISGRIARIVNRRDPARLMELVIKYATKEQRDTIWAELSGDMFCTVFFLNAFSRYFTGAYRGTLLFTCNNAYDQVWR